MLHRERDLVLVVSEGTETLDRFVRSMNEYHDVMVSNDLASAVERAVRIGPDLIILTGSHTAAVDACRQLKSSPLAADIPVIILASSPRPEDRIRGFDAGAADWICRPCAPEEVTARARIHLSHRDSTREITRQNETLEARVHERTSELNEALTRLDTTAFEVILRLARAAELRDNDTGRHILRVSRLAMILSSCIGLDDSRVRNIYRAAPMHDVGKIGIPDDILLKTGPLTSHEMERMKTHTSIGARILEGSVSPEVNLAETIALTHHERWDGTGYPNGISGTDIPLEGRILAVADVFDALTSRRPYKTAHSIDEAVSIIIREKGRHFDPNLVDAFSTEVEKLIGVVVAYSDEGPTDAEFNLLKEFT